MEYFDYIIVGGGAAGCVLANRLSADDQHKVLLLEQGGAHQSLLAKMPAATILAPLSKRSYTNYRIGPERFIKDRIIGCVQGKILGGGSSINNLIYVRGHALDFDTWAQMTSPHWSYASCLPYFKRAESFMLAKKPAKNSKKPPMTADNRNYSNPLFRAFVEAGAQAGYGKTRDFNGHRQEGFGPLAMTASSGTQANTTNTYLKACRNRKNLCIVTHAVVTHIKMEDKTAKAVVYKKGNTVKIARTNREIILAAGAIGSPQLLQTSGIGPANVLKAAGVPPSHHLPGVGDNLQDRMEICLKSECRQAITLNDSVSWLNKVSIYMNWAANGRGIGSSNQFEAGGYIRSRSGVRWPDIHYHILPCLLEHNTLAKIRPGGFQINMGPARPRSRGWLRITTQHVQDKPKLTFNYQSDPYDRETFRRCIRLAREILEQPAMDTYRGTELSPGRDIHFNDQIDDWVQCNARSSYSLCGTNKMGDPIDPTSVVDHECKVLGIRGLRVVDSSVFPIITNGHLLAPTIMLAEKVADMILNKPLLVPAKKPAIWEDSQWQVRQREGHRAPEPLPESSVEIF